MQPARSTYAGVARPAVVETNNVLKNTYLLLAATLLFSAATAGIAMFAGMPPLNPFIVLAGYFALLFATVKTRNSALGLVFVFALTGFMGLTLGPIISLYLTMLPNGNEVVMTALGTTGATFVGLSAYAVKSKRDFSFLGGFLFVGILGAFLLGIFAYLFSMPMLSLAVSGMFVIAMAGLILWQTSEIVRGGETNYIMATVTLYVSIYNLFTSLLHLFGVLGDE
ncbi:MAG TPA: Bax inhibitor-1/YccA family protein [Gammaproteobacteria bacterium]|nr:Bax inhibitor-1/YccA family protein [Gammaproteobacteria bacterium]HRP88359.1 Bax inhibitor-1/YccA family protein [Gammaproteobacteria bacterium]